MNIDLSSIQNKKIIEDLEKDEIVPEIPEIEEINIEEEIELSADDIIYKNNLISKIKQYHNIFNKFLIDKDISNLEERKIEELEKLLTDIKDIVANRNIKQNIESLIKTIPDSIEFMACNYTPLKLNGFSKMLLSNEDFYYNCHEIILEYELFDNVKTKPEFRLGYQILLSAMMCHKINTMMENNININNNINSNLNSKVSNDIKSKFDNL